MPIRIERADDQERFLQTDLLVWADGRSADPTETILHGIQPEQRFAAITDDPETDPTTYAGIYGVYDLELSIPGPRDAARLVPVAGLTWVGVHPDERRRGVLTAMLRDHFERTAAADATGISALHASEPEIYGRFGYAVASVECTATLNKGATLKAAGLEEAAARIRTRLATAQTPGIPARMRAAAQAAARTGHGQVVREVRTFEAFTHEGPEMLRDKEPSRVILATEDGQDVGYAWFRRKPKWEAGQPAGIVEVEIIGTPAAQLALARRVLELDLMSKVEVGGRPREDLLRLWSQDSRGVHGPTYDSLWLRLVDLPTAMAARGYACAGDLVLDVADDFLPEQGGRWRLVADAEGVGRVERTDAEAEVSLSTQQLAAAYLGDGSLPARLGAGLLTEHRAGAVRELDLLLSTPTAPAGAVGF